MRSEDSPERWKSSASVKSSNCSGKWNPTRDLTIQNGNHQSHDHTLQPGLEQAILALSSELKCLRQDVSRMSDRMDDLHDNFNPGRRPAPANKFPGNLARGIEFPDSNEDDMMSLISHT